MKIKKTDPKKLHVVNKRTLQSIASYLENEHLDLIFKELSENQTDIDYSVLVYDLKGQINEEKIRDIEGAFNLLDNRREGEFPISYMVSRFLSRNSRDNF